MLHWSENLHATQPLSGQRRSVHVFLKSFLPISLRRADVAEVGQELAKNDVFDEKWSFWGLHGGHIRVLLVRYYIHR